MRMTNFVRTYGITTVELSEKLGISQASVWYWHKTGKLKNYVVNENIFYVPKKITRLYANIKSRCNNSNDKKFKYYGGKGIKSNLTISDLRFLWDRDNAKDMIQPSLDRKNSDKNYSIENCQFIEMKENRAKRWIKKNV